MTSSLMKPPAEEPPLDAKEPDQQTSISHSIGKLKRLAVEASLAVENTPKLIAFYLPQFHPIPENDAAWGPGFTEWTNVTKARRLFSEHYQPHLPAELGFYDLRIPKIMESQAELARSYGIYGFCYYYYWFDGRRVLEKPLELMLNNKNIDIPFCLCWANENWTRRWDGSDDEIILSQTFDSNSHTSFIDDLIPYFEDDRYITIDGKPLLLVYRPDIIKNLKSTVYSLKELARERGFELCIAACLTFGFDDPVAHGFDVGIEFPPHGLSAPEINNEIDWKEPFTGHAYSYADAVARELTKPERPFKVYRAAMAGWDNTARRGAKGNLFCGANPKDFEAWLSALVIRSRRHRDEDNIIFINAWNEWAEGAHLEPDQRFGRQWLMACSRALHADCVDVHSDHWQHYLDFAEKSPDLLREQPIVADLIELLMRSGEKIRGLEAINAALSRFYVTWLDTSSFAQAAPLAHDPRLTGISSISGIAVDGWIDTPSDELTQTNGTRPLYVKGWICPRLPLPHDEMQCIVSFLSLDRTDDPLSTIASYGVMREDVSHRNPELPVENAWNSGFQVYVDMRTVPAGIYSVLVGLLTKDGASYINVCRQLQLTMS